MSGTLYRLQQEHGIHHGYKDDVFAGWVPGTGYHLVETMSEAEISRAEQVRRYAEEYRGRE